jgi:hypothetical protein
MSPWELIRYNSWAALKRVAGGARSELVSPGICRVHKAYCRPEELLLIINDPLTGIRTWDYDFFMSQYLIQTAERPLIYAS